MHIIVLGGAGAMGRVTVRALTGYADVDQVTIADYNEERARELADAKDVPILAAAIGAGARILVPHNIRRTLIEEVRGWLASLGT